VALSAAAEHDIKVGDGLDWLRSCAMFTGEAWAARRWVSEPFGRGGETMEKVKDVFGRGIFFTGRIRALVSILLGICVYLTNEVYDLLNHGPVVLRLQTALDRALPLVPLFVIPYVSLNPFVYASLVLFLLFRNRVFQSAALSMIGAWLVSYLFYFFLQTEVLRPTITAAGPLFDMIRAVYAGDQPFNDFPSLHTSISTILAIHWFRVDRRIGWPVAIWTALIVASTVFVKQHYMADLVAGLALAFGVTAIVTRLFLRNEAH
jgi:membrane-associated phospholipid phosphatase